MRQEADQRGWSFLILSSLRPSVSLHSPRCIHACVSRQSRMDYQSHIFVSGICVSERPRTVFLMAGGKLFSSGLIEPQLHSNVATCTILLRKKPKILQRMNVPFFAVEGPLLYDSFSPLFSPHDRATTRQPFSRLDWTVSSSLSLWRTYRTIQPYVNS